MRQSAEAIHVPQPAATLSASGQTPRAAHPAPRPLLRHRPPRDETDFLGSRAKSPTCSVRSPTRGIKSATRHDGQPTRLPCPPIARRICGFRSFGAVSGWKALCFHLDLPWTENVGLVNGTFMCSSHGLGSDKRNGNLMSSEGNQAGETGNKSSRHASFRAGSNGSRGLWEVNPGVNRCGRLLSHS